jgi:ribosome-associated heat shock protein Hsp15
MGELADNTVRIDKWLWAARFFKTRGLAVDAIDAGHVRRAASGGMQGDRLKPAYNVRLGDSFSIQRGDMAQIVFVEALSDRRGNATEAAKLYRETPESLRNREEKALARKASDAAQSWPVLRGRPTKQDRRSLAHFFAKNYRDSTDP